MTNFLMVKVCVLGVSTVGKTCIASRYVQDTFDPYATPTLGAAFLSRYCTAPNGTVYKFQIWDTAGMERYKTLAPLYYRGASVILIVYDISNRDSFTIGVKDWVKELQGKGLDDAQWILIGNKHDLAPIGREVQEAEASQYAEDIGAAFYEASAKSGHNVANIFIDLATNLEKSESKSRALASKDINLRKRDTIKVKKEPEQPHKHNGLRKCCPT